MDPMTDPRAHQLTLELLGAGLHFKAALFPRGDRADDPMRVLRLPGEEGLPDHGADEGRKPPPAPEGGWQYLYIRMSNS